VDKIVDPDHPSARDARMREQGVFDLLGANVRGVVDDDLLLAPAEKEVAVRRRLASHRLSRATRC
jgi:hypothetical protein